MMIYKEIKNRKLQQNLKQIKQLIFYNVGEDES